MSQPTPTPTPTPNIFNINPGYRYVRAGRRSCGCGK